MIYVWQEKGEENRKKIYYSNELQHLKTVLINKISYKPEGIQDMGMNSAVILKGSIFKKDTFTGQTPV